MALAKKDAIAEAIKESLNLGLYSETKHARRLHVFERKLEDVVRIDGSDEYRPIVTVFPLAERKVRTSRSSYAREFDIGICFQVHCLFTETAMQDKYGEIVEAVTEYIGTAGKMAGAAFMSLELDQIFDSAMLREKSIYESIPQFTYRIGN